LLTIDNIRAIGNLFPSNTSVPANELFNATVARNYKSVAEN